MTAGDIFRGNGWFLLVHSTKPWRREVSDWFCSYYTFPPRVVANESERNLLALARFFLSSFPCVPPVDWIHWLVRLTWACDSDVVVSQMPAAAVVSSYVHEEGARAGSP